MCVSQPIPDHSVCDQRSSLGNKCWRCYPEGDLKLRTRSHASNTTWQTSAETAGPLHCSVGWAAYYRTITSNLRVRIDADAHLFLQAYISGNAVIILGSPQHILQTVYIDDVDSLEAITIEETSGAIAVCGGSNVYIYKPFGREEDVLRVWALCAN